MAIVYAVANGNWSSTATWNTGALPTSSDDVYANNFTVTIDQNITVISLNTTATTGVTAGGFFDVSGSRTIVCDTIQAGSQYCLRLFQAAINSTVVLTCNTINGSITTASNAQTGTGVYFAGILNGVFNTNLTINGNIYTKNAPGFFCNGTLTATNNTIVINGNIYGSDTLSNFSSNSHATMTVNGVIVGGTIGIGFQTTAATGTVAVTKCTTVNTGQIALISTTSTPTVTVKEIEQGNFGAVPISGFVRLSTASGAFYKGVTTGSSTRTLTDVADIAGQVPAQSDVRFGVTYQSGAKTGTAYIPSPSSVGFGVPVDNTTGTAALTPASVWDAATSSLTTASSIGERLKNASTVDTTGDQLAALL
jgi:hypothetical protein